MSELSGLELVLGLVGAIGTDLDLISDELRIALGELDYATEVVHVIELIHEIDRWGSLPETPLDERIKSHMDAGDEVRDMLERGDALALLAIADIVRHRRMSESSNERRAYILRSLKHPDEVTALRRVYGPNFFLIAAYARRSDRLNHLASKIAASHNVLQSNKFRPVAEELNQRDEADVGNVFGQNVRKTFPKADFFLNAGDLNGLRESVRRVVELLFGYPFHTPTRDEHGMFHARAGALRSASLGRQVGAAISTPNGEVVAIGTNDVPKAGGGLYWTGDPQDQRDFMLKHDTNDSMKRRVFGDILKRLRDHEWLNDSVVGNSTADELVKKALGEEAGPGFMRGALFMNLIEFGRSVHAEMAALIDAARRGVSVDGCHLYTTTFPCHDCAKHIVAAGIPRVVYVEPYPKSLVPELYLDSISVDGYVAGGEAVRFEAFVGVAPRRFLELFSMPRRKQRDGRIVEWQKTTAEPRLVGIDTHLQNEPDELEFLQRTMEAKGLKPVS